MRLSHRLEEQYILIWLVRFTVYVMATSKIPRVLSQLQDWKLEDAKARFSEVVRLAREQGPQRVTVYGEDVVVILSAADYARLAPTVEQPSLPALLSQSPLRDLDFEQAGIPSPVRDVTL
jgi:prevent-host-death family protein